MPRIEDFEHGQLGYDEGFLAEWLASATLPGASVPNLEDGPLAVLVAEAAGSLEAFTAAAAAAFDSAAARGATALSDDDVAVGLAAAALSGGE